MKINAFSVKLKNINWILGTKFKLMNWNLKKEKPDEYKNKQKVNDQSLKEEEDGAE